MKSVSLFALAALFLASSGLTVILHDCVMMKAEIACCAPLTMSTGDDLCAENPSAVFEPAISSAQSCHSNTIIGGLGVHQALVQKNDISDDIVPGFSDPVWTADLSQSTSSIVALRTFDVGYSPPAAYLLNSSFLI